MRKTFCSVAFVCATLVFNSCGDSESSEGMFGEIPQIYQKEGTALIEKLKKDSEKESDSKADALKALSAFADGMEKIEAKAKPLAEKMVGQAVRHTESDSLNFTVISPITIKEMTLPQFNLLGRNKSAYLTVEYDIVMKEDLKETNTMLLNYLLTGPQGPVYYGYFKVRDNSKKHSRIEKGSLIDRTIYYLAAGDTLHVEGKIYAPAPETEASIQDACQEVRFVTQETYNKECKNISEKYSKKKEEK